MKRFLIQTLLFCLITLIGFLSILSTADGYADHFYIKFTSPKQENLILGTSRAAQGLQPSVLKRYLKRDFFNYSFTVAHSPYGPVYLESIKKKLKQNTSNGMFIVTVDPWSISSTTKEPNDVTKFRENKLCLANTYFVNMNPNFEYLIENLKGKYYTLLSSKKNKVFIHEDGWTEVTVSMDSASVSKRLKDKLKEYREKNLPNFKLSRVRVDYLKKIIQFLNFHGEVYLVRLPVHPEIFEMEVELMPEFDSIISSVTPLTKGYLDMTGENAKYQYTDGNHLYKKSGTLVSEKIAHWVGEVVSSSLLQN